MAYIDDKELARLRAIEYASRAFISNWTRGWRLSQDERWWDGLENGNGTNVMDHGRRLQKALDKLPESPGRK